VEWLKCEALSSNPSTAKKKNWEGKEWNKLEETNTNNNNDDNHNKFKGTKVPH
jgi:hypothetical protein